MPAACCAAGWPRTRAVVPLLIGAALAACGGGPAGPPVTHGPILGLPSAEGVGVWARTLEPGAFRVRYGLSPTAMTATSEAVRTRLESDNTGWVRIRGLQPGTRYFYRLEAGGAESPLASFRTLPATEADPDHNPDGLFNFSFEFACGNKQTDGNQPTYRTLLEDWGDGVHFAIQNGDWLYEEQRDFSAADWLRVSGGSELPERVRIAPTIAGAWQNYKLYLDRGRDMAAWHRTVPSFFVFDDHEILGDVNGAGTIGLRSRRAAFRDIGIQAWHDYLGWANPMHHDQSIHFGRALLEEGSDILTDTGGGLASLDLAKAATLTVHWGGETAGVNLKELDEQGGDPNAGVYAVEAILDDNTLRIRPAARADSAPSYSIGRLNYWSRSIGNADFFFLDTRSHRQLHDKDDPFKPGVSMLGPGQKRWLAESMASSQADFLFVVSSVNLMIPHVGPGMGGPNKDEAWTAIAAEREELIEFWDGLGKPVFVLTGDLHNSFAIKVTDTVWEFASGPRSSGNHPLLSEAGRPPNGDFESRGRMSQIRWSTFFLDDSGERRRPVFCIVRISNVFENPDKEGKVRRIAYPRPQAIFQYYDGLSGDLLYAESVLAEAG